MDNGSVLKKLGEEGLGNLGLAEHAGLDDFEGRCKLSPRSESGSVDMGALLLPFHTACLHVKDTCATHSKESITEPEKLLGKSGGASASLHASAWRPGTTPNPG